MATVFRLPCRSYEKAELLCGNEINQKCILQIEEVKMDGSKITIYEDFQVEIPSDKFPSDGLVAREGRSEMLTGAA